MIDRNEHVRCSWCYGVSPLGDWNDLTYSQCTNREMKRAFRSLKNRQVWGKESKNFYKCPNCANWSRGNKLRVISDNAELSKLGNEPLFKINDNQ